MRVSSLGSKIFLIPLTTVCLACVAAAGPNDPDYIPVAKRPRAEVLVKGADYVHVDLTRAAINDYRDLVGWILQIRFTDAQCDEFEQMMILRWPRMLKMDTDIVTGAGKQIAEVRAMPAAQLRAMHSSWNEQVLKNLRDMVGGALMLDNFHPVTDDDRREARWLLSVYEEQHPEAVAPMPALPDLPARPARPAPDAGAPADGEKAGDATIAPGAVPLKKSAADAMANVVCFLSAKSAGAAFAPPGQEFCQIFARTLAAEYPGYTEAQQAAMAKLPAYWTALSANWDRMSQHDRDETIARWKPLLDSLQSAGASLQNLSAEDESAVARLSEELARTRAEIAQMRAMQRLDQNQKLAMQRLEMQQQMQNQQIQMMSNIARSAHETNMRIIDNMGPTRHPWD